MKSEITVYDKIEAHLFKDKQEALENLTERDMKVKERIMLCVSKMMSQPWTQDKDIVSFLTGGCGGICTPVSQTQAYRDVAAITKIVGSLQLASKAWYRYLIVEASKKGIEIAITESDSKGVAANTDKIGKYTRADKEDDSIDWNNLYPPIFEPTDEVAILDGRDKDPDFETKRKELREMFKGMVFNNVSEANIVDNERITDK